MSDILSVIEYRALYGTHSVHEGSVEGSMVSKTFRKIQWGSHVCGYVCLYIRPCVR